MHLHRPEAGLVRKVADDAARARTASLSTELREENEREFAEMRINLPSCTTTMEMGVDRGVDFVRRPHYEKAPLFASVEASVRPVPL